MATIGFLVTRSPLQYEHVDTASAIAEAALDKGHQVKLFLYLDGTYTPNQYQTFPDLPVMPKDKFATLVAKGAQIIACGVCVNARGLQKGKDYIEGVRVGGLPDFAEQLGEVDRLITL
jgi:tRNA 2-thiouridine synthesizing protein D